MTLEIHSVSYNFVQKTLINPAAQQKLFNFLEDMKKSYFYSAFEK
jgi:hypothetical protein